MGRHITIIDGHPDNDPLRFMHMLAAEYERGALAAGHEVRRIAVSDAGLPLLRTAAEYREPTPPPAVRSAQESLVWANHWVILYPLWLGSMPALLKGFLEQTLRPGFAYADSGDAGLPKKLLAGRSARVIVTMGMPALIYRWYFRAHSLKNLERNILRFVGIAPVRHTIIGNIEGISLATRQHWLSRVYRLGELAK
jgi:putative NADPH-quinone reductase